MLNGPWAIKRLGEVVAKALDEAMEGSGRCKFRFDSVRNLAIVGECGLEREIAKGHDEGANG